MSKSIRPAAILAAFIGALLLSVFLRFPWDKDKVYYSQDASYHVLLTACAYGETPASVHKYLPLITLGTLQDKYIPWEDTLCDSEGNYYYTSFSAAGFFLPYLFFRAFRLSVTMENLYLFNSFLYLLCTFFTWYLFRLLFSRDRDAWLTGLFAALIYAFQTETLHSQGIVYWHHSLFQLLFLLQLLCFIKGKTLPFLFFCLLNPYTEWTGYVANGGFALIYLLRKDGKRFLSTCIATVGALALFILHYASVLPFNEVISALYKRFFARGITSAVSWTAFIKGYFCSYGFFLAILFFLLIFTLVNIRRRQTFLSSLKERWEIFFLLLFPLLENLLMQQHVVFYSYDRLKCTLPMIYLFLLCLKAIPADSKYGGKILKTGIAAVILMACCNMTYYLKADSFYSHTADYLEDNILLAEYIKEHYPAKDRLTGQNNATRGYSNLLFHGGIYEYQDALSGLELLNNERYYVYLNSEDLPFNIYRYDYALVYDTFENTVTRIHVQNGTVYVKKQ